jgi:predicted ABC-type ATPase
LKNKAINGDKETTNLFYYCRPKRRRKNIKHSGYDIPNDTIYRRFPRIMYNLINTYIPLCDKVICYDNSKPNYAPVFEKSGKNLRIFDQNIYERIIRQSNEYKKTQ